MKILQKREERWKRFSHAEGEGGTTRFWVVLTHTLEVLAILKGAQNVSTL